MRSRTLVILAVILTMAVLVPIQGSDADAPARLYFFDEDNKLIKEVVMMPGEMIKSGDLPSLATGWDWYDDDGYQVSSRAYGSGDHIVKAYYYTDRPYPAPEDPNYGLIIGLIAIIGGVIVASAYFFIFKK